MNIIKETIMLLRESIPYICYQPLRTRMIDLMNELEKKLDTISSI